LNEIADLQKALSDAQNYLFDERKQLLKVVAENDNLRLQELKDRKKIRYLLALQSAPEEQEITYFKDGLEKRFVQRSSSTAPTGRLPSKESKVNFG
jgi:coiled-coil domain-containing protein 77